MVCLDDLSTGTRENVAHLQGHDRFSLVVTDVSEKVELDGRVQGRRRVQPGLAGVAAGVPRPAARHAGRRQRGHPPAARAGAARTGPASSWRARARSTATPRSTPRSSRYRGNVDPTGPAQRLRRGQAVRRGPDHGHAPHPRGRTSASPGSSTPTGPRLSPGDGRVVSNFIVQALRGEPLTVYGDGSQTRSLCFVDDEIAGLLALLDSSLVGPVNIGNPDERTMLDLAHFVLEVTGSSSDIVLRAAAHRRPDAPLPRHHAGPPRAGLGAHGSACGEGIERTIDYFARRA